MNRLPRAGVLLATVTLALILAACGSGTPAPNPYGPARTASPSTAPGSGDIAVPESPLEGVVIEVATEGLDDVKSFTLRTTDGQSWMLEIGTLTNASEFPPAHLVEHKATAAPVRVSFHVEGGVLIADRIEDAS